MINWIFRILCFSRKHVQVSLLLIPLVFSSQASQAVHLMHTASTFADQAEDRRVGIEIEFTGLSLAKTIEIIQSRVGGMLVKKEKLIKTTLKEIVGTTMIFNEAVIPEWVLQNTRIGNLTVKIDNNQVNDETETSEENAVIELVTSPIRKKEVITLQSVVNALVANGAKGTDEGQAVSIQYNTEINNGDIANLDYQFLVNLLRVYMKSIHRQQIDPYLSIPDFRADYVQLYSPGFRNRLFQADYHPSPRELFDDFFYRQSLELLGFDQAWSLELSTAKKLLLEQNNPVVPLVVKQNKLRISSLLAMAFPEDPLTKIYISSGWIVPMPIVEWREFNNDFNVLGHYREVLGLMAMTEKYGDFDHDTLMSQLSGIDSSMIRNLRSRTLKSSGENSAKNSAPVIYRYLIGNSKAAEKRDYKDIARAYETHPTGFLPFYEYGTYPLSLPGESVVMHRNQFHRFNIVGTHNPGLINGFIMQALENQYVEMRLWSDFASKGIPKTELLSRLGVESLHHQSNSKTIRQLKETLRILNQQFPEGWVLKGLFDLGTEKQILSDKTDFLTAVNIYLKSDFESYKKAINDRSLKLEGAQERATDELHKHAGYKGWKILQLLANVDTVMIQQRFNIDREFRVEVVAGQVLGGGSTIDRFGYLYQKNGHWDATYQPPTRSQIQSVENYVRDLLASLPPELAGMSFGMDIAITKEGEVVMIESNPGGNSGFLFEDEPKSIKRLSEFLISYPALVQSKVISSGLSPKAQMQFLKKKFAEWQIDTASLYPGMRFLEDRIEDQEYSQRSPIVSKGFNEGVDLKKSSLKSSQLESSMSKVGRCQKSLIK